MSYQDELTTSTTTHDEDARTQRAVNDAAKDRSANDDTTYTPFGSHERAYPTTDSPDLILTADGDPDTGMYRYFLWDAQTRLGHHACGRLPAVEPHAITIYAISAALRSIRPARINEALCERYGFDTRRAAQQSLKRLIVQISVTDKELAELGQVVADAAQDDLVPFIRTPHQSAYGALSNQLHRFECRFKHIAESDQTLVRMRGWAEAAMKRAVHDGPVYSGFETFTAPVQNRQNEQQIA